MLSAEDCVGCRGLWRTWPYLKARPLGLGSSNLSKLHNAKAREIQRALIALGKKLDEGDDSELLVWVIPQTLACAHRPLRRHPQYGGAQRDLPAEAAPLVLAWVRRMKAEGIRSVVCLIGDRELRHYLLSDVGASDLIELYRKEGLDVWRVHWEDPAHPAVSTGPSYEEQLLETRAEALKAFDQLPKPVLLHCSSGIQRSSPVAAFIFSQRSTK